MSGRSSEAERTEARLICREVAKLVAAAREIEPDYARRSAAVGSHCIAKLLRDTNCTLTFARLDDDCAGMTLPRVGGLYTVVINRNDQAVDTWVTVRHELAHVLRGDVDEPTFLDGEEMGWTERLADTFALADVLPAWEIRAWRRGGRPWREVVEAVAQYVSEFAPGWPERRAMDRARLRLTLYRTQGI
jgi:hypothetical protein